MAETHASPHEGDLRPSPLHARHLALGAKFAPFAGWEMPLEYDGVIAEHTAVRSKAGVFDVSHLGKLWITGPGAVEFVNSCFSNDLNRIKNGGAQYTLCCTFEGGVVDDIICYRFDEDKVLAIPNAANNAEVARRLRDAAPADIRVDDEHTEYAVLAVQGPEAPGIVAELGLPIDHEDFMEFKTASFEDVEVIICRTGYTGEKGFELLVPSAEAGRVWDALMEKGVQPCGLGARDTLRLEMGYPLHGNDLSVDITPVQARLIWAVGWDKPDFWGKEILAAEREAKPRRRLWGLESEGRRPLRAGMEVYDGETKVGETTSGGFAPSLQKGIALGLVSTQYKVGAELEVDVRGRRMPVKMVKPPFVASSTRY
ncbi:glycine cleavage system aminomethyltransferase GcvT [Salininema proteolyticum]|uniref:Aminomethyltransferase n=1 Tax=Salininema proteolyticum TaxID=1607685 RepID=A0ABV8U2N4_9ACTN